MKKGLVLFVVMLALNLSAQNNLSIKGGLNITDQVIKIGDDRINDNSEDKYSVGYNLGLGYDFYIVDEHLSIEPAIIIQARGSKYKEKNNGDKISSKHVLHYLDIPIMVKGGFVTSGGVRIYAAFGPSIGILLTGKSRNKQKIDGHRSGGFSQLDIGNDDLDDYKRFDIALNVSPGIEVKKFGFNYTYGFGLLNTISSANSDYKGKNRTHSLSMSYMFLAK
ncbi:MAG: porin family protein [Chitinophagales bacterium]